MCTCTARGSQTKTRFAAELRRICSAGEGWKKTQAPHKRIRESGRSIRQGRRARDDRRGRKGASAARVARQGWLAGHSAAAAAVLLLLLPQREGL